MANLMSQNIIEFQARSVGVAKAAGELKNLKEVLAVTGKTSQEAITILARQFQTINTSSGIVEKQTYVWKTQNGELQKTIALYDQLSRKILDARTVKSTRQTDLLTNIQGATAPGEISQLTSDIAANTKISPQSFSNFGNVVTRSAKNLTDVLGVAGQQGKQFTAIWRGLDGTLNQTQTTFIETAQGLKLVEGSSKTTAIAADNLGKEVKQGQTLMQGWGEALARVGVVVPIWMLARAAIQLFTNTIKDAVKFSVEFETALARIMIVGKGSKEEIKRLGQEVLIMSEIYGVSAKSALEAAKVFAQQGLGINQIATLTKVAMIASQVLETDMVSAVNDITAALKGFKLSTEDSINVINVWAAVEKEFAITSKDLAGAMRVISATANQMGVTLSEVTGDITAIIEVTRQSGETAARGLSFVYTRLVTSAKDVLKSVAGINVYLTQEGKVTAENTGILRRHADILSELASKWSGLTKEERLHIAEALGSKRQMTTINALMQNYNQSLAAQVVALTSAGQAAKSFNLLQETTAFKVQQADASWKLFTASLINTSAFKVAIEGVINLNGALLKLLDNPAWNKQQAVEVTVKGLEEDDKLLSQIKNAQELIILRAKLQKDPLTNSSLLKQIDDYTQTLPDAIKNAATAVDGTLALKALETETLMKKFRREAAAPFLTELAYLEDAQSNQSIPEKLRLSEEFKLSNEKRIAEIKRTVDEEAKKRLEQYNVELALSTQISEETLDKTEDLIEKQQEQLDIERELIILKHRFGVTTDEIKQKEIELVQQSKFIYSQEEKALKLKQLANEKLDAQLASSTTKAQNRISILIQGERELNEIIGASRFAILQRNLDVAKTDEEKLKARLEIEKEITKEKYGQASFTSREQKLFEISQKYGTGTAQKVANIFQGGFTTQEVNESSVGGLFKKSFADEFKNRTMTEFFKKPENVGLLQNVERNNLQSILSEANRIKQVPDVNTNVQVYIDGKEITAKVVKQVETEFKNPNSDLTNVATKAIKDKTGI